MTPLRDVGRGAEGHETSSDPRPPGLSPREAGSPPSGGWRRGADRLASLAAVSAARTATLRDAVGLGLAVGLYGVAFGAAADAAGLDVW